MNPPFPPREGDLPREELMKKAQKEIGPNGQWPGGTVYFKFTCQHCGNRCMFQEPNQLYEKGECNECGKETNVECGGFTVMFTLGGHHD
jgi:hypothetical protein